MENAEVTWHYHMMGSEGEIKKEEPAFYGITRDNVILSEVYRLAKKRFPDFPWQLASVEARSWEQFNKMCDTWLTPEYISENYPQYADLDIHEAIYCLTGGIHHQAMNIADDGSHYADECPVEQWYVMILRQNRVYRGPQEGGIMGVNEEFIKWTSFNTKKEARRFVKAYNIEAREKKRDGDYSILGDDDTVSSIYPEGYIPTGWVASTETFARLCVLPYLSPPQPWRYE